LKKSISSSFSHFQDKEKDKERKSHHHTSSSRDDKHRHRHSSSSKSKKKDKDREREKDRHERKKDEKRDRDRDDRSDPKEKVKEREKKKEQERIRLEKIEEKINQRDMLKSEKFKSFDMFAPKAPKPKNTPIISAVTPRLERSTSATLASPVASPTIGGKTLFAAKSTSLPSYTSSNVKSSNTSKEIDFSRSNSKSSSKSKTLSSQSSSDACREAALSGDSPIFERRVPPELPVSKCDGDKRKQHESDFHDTKRLLDEARQRREAAHQREKEEKKKRKLSTGNETPREKPKVEAQVAKTSKSTSKKDRRVSSSETPKPRRKVFESSDDTSDEEWRKGKNGDKSSGKKRQKKNSTKLRFDDSSSGEEESVAVSKDDNPVMTRKLLQTTQADAVLNGDPKMEISYGFDESQIESNVKFEIDNGDMSDSSEVDTLTPLLSAKSVDTNLIYLDNLSNPEKTLQLLKRIGIGRPKIVRSIPVWFEEKLEAWSLRRQDVDVIFPDEVKKIRNKRKIMTEREFDATKGIESRVVEEPKKMRIEDILMEEMPDIVTSITPEPPTKVEDKVDDVAMETVEQPKKVEAPEIDQKVEKSEVEEPAFVNEPAVAEDVFRGCDQVDDRYVIPMVATDMNGNTFCLPSEFTCDDSSSDSENFEIMITQELQDHYTELLKDDADSVEIFRRIAVRRLPPILAPAFQQEQEYVGGGLKEVSDEFLSESHQMDYEPTPPKRSGRKSTSKPKIPKTPKTPKVAKTPGKMLFKFLTKNFKELFTDKEVRSIF
jgi:hypothetical protein